MKKIWGVLLILLLMTACQERQHQRSIYYWSTTFQLDSTKRTFLKEHQINRIYLRYFDVVVDDNGEPMPNATVRFREKSSTVVTTSNDISDPYDNDTSLREAIEERFPLLEVEFVDGGQSVYHWVIGLA